ncbi:potassium channel family protein [Paenibacillus sp. FSL K6-1096]|uniref:potassium channel family protein n=1 Tax=Paenibacillus sp. FSL K6-1096 TaxID=2921460 RepID=UPI0030EBADCA
MVFRRQVILVLSLIWIISLFCNHTQVSAENNPLPLQHVKITKVIDLVTLKAGDGRIIPLYGISNEYVGKYNQKLKDASTVELPEGGELYTSGTYFKGESIEHLVDRGIRLYQELVLGTTVYLEEASANSFIVYLDSAKQHSLNQLAVKAGFVTVSKDHRKLPNLLIQQEEARMLKSGLWDIIVYVDFPGSWASSNTIPYTLVFVWLNFVFSLVVYTLYTRNRTVLGVIALYSALILNTGFPASQIYFANSIHEYFWVPPVIFLSFVLICVSEFVLFIFSRVKKNLLYVTLEIFLFMVLVIVGFAILYQGYSNTTVTRSEISYSLPDFEYSSNIHKEEPAGDYILLPDSEYGAGNPVEVNHSNIENKHYHLSLLNAVYFSATTFFTVGYGDFSPKGFLKILSMIEMAIGSLSQIILFSIMISKISLPGSASSSSRDQAAPLSGPIPTRTSRIKSNQAAAKKTKPFVNLLYIILIIENLYVVYQFFIVDRS